MRLSNRKHRHRKRRVSAHRTRKWLTHHKRTRFLKAKQFTRGKFPMFLGVLCLCISIIYLLFFTALLHVIRVHTTTEYKDINVEKLQSAISELVLQKNTMLISISEIEKEIYDRFPDVSSVICHRQVLRRTLSCEAIGYELVAVINHLKKKYYINENGVIIAYDARKLGLPIFDLILNPVYMNDVNTGENTDTESLAGISDPVKIQAKSTGPAIPYSNLNFISPDEPPPPEPIIHQRSVFDVVIGKKILDPDEIKTILDTIQEMETVLQRKVINAQYVQVAGELSLKSKPARRKDIDTERVGTLTDTESLSMDEDPEHEFTVFFDLRRSLEDQFAKLKKSKEVIDFSTIERIDLSIDGEKIFYR